MLAGGSGTRLWPITRGVSKQLLPVYDKPMIHYPLATLMAAGLREVLLITTQEDATAFQRLLGDGSNLGMTIEYAVQHEPRGLAEAFIIGADFLNGGTAALILGDNLFHGTGLGRALGSLHALNGAHIFAYEVANPTDYGIVEFDDGGRVLSLTEKPVHPASAYAVPGLYFYDERVVDIAHSLKPSTRGELEITDLNCRYLEMGDLTVSVLPRGTAWLDTGTFTTLQDAGEFVRVLEQRQGIKIGCLEEVAWRNGWITDDGLAHLARPLLKSGYGDYLLRLIATPDGSAQIP